MRVYGYKFDEVLELPAKTFYILTQQSKAIDAENLLAQIMVASSPYMKRGDRSSVIRKLERATKVNKPATIDEISHERERLRKLFKKI